jgi:hypothetical protein
MPYYFITIFSILLFFKLDRLIQAIQSKKNVFAELLVTLLSILIVVCLYLFTV